MKEFIELKDLEVYQLAKQLSSKAWELYESMDWQVRKIMGDQFIESADSVGANIAEGYRRYHYLDKIKFYYNSRASLAEACSHWLELLRERGKITDKNYEELKELEKKIEIKLANFIKTTYQSIKK
jgi:four helix bundle protein